MGGGRLREMSHIEVRLYYAVKLRHNSDSELRFQSSLRAKSSVRHRMKLDLRPK